MRFSIAQRSIFLGSLLALFLAMDPFGINSASQEYDHQLILRYSAPFLPVEYAGEIVIVLIDDMFIERQKKTLPLSYSDLRLILKRINRAEADIVFFDILHHFKQVSEGGYSRAWELWLRELKKSTDGGLSVVMASSYSKDTKQTLADMSSLRYQLNSVSELASVTFDEGNNYYPLLQTQKGPIEKSAAYSLYESWCELRGLDCQGEFSEPMLVRWSNYPFENQQEYYPGIRDCQVLERNKLLQTLTSIWMDLSSGIINRNGINSSYYHSCTPFATISADELLKQGSYSDKELSNLLKNKVVFVGYGLNGSNDTVISPVNNKLAGVYFHAAAFHNLIELGDNYWRKPATFSGSKFGWFDIVNFIMQSIIFSLVIMYKKKYIEINRELDGVNKVKAFKEGVRNAILLFAIILSVVILANHISRVDLVNSYVLFIALLYAVPTWLIYVGYSPKYAMYCILYFLSAVSFIVFIFFKLNMALFLCFCLLAIARLIYILGGLKFDFLTHNSTS